MIYEEENFKALRRRAGYKTYEEAAKYCGVCVSTIKKWDRHGAPVAILKLFQLLNQDLSAHDPKWRGFRFINGKLVNHQGKAFAWPDQLLSWENRESLLKIYESQIIPELKAENEALKEKVEVIAKQKSATYRHTPWNRSRIGITTRIILPPEVKK